MGNFENNKYGLQNPYLIVKFFNFLSLGFSRAVVSACVSGMLVLLVRIQFSVLAAYMYLDKTKIVSERDM